MRRAGGSGFSRSLFGAARRRAAALVPACMAVFALGCRSVPVARWGAGVVEYERIVADLPGVPASWRRVKTDGAMLTFAPPEERQLVLINGRCGLANDDVPLVSLTQQLLAGTSSRTMMREERVPFDGREALRSFYVAKLDGVPRFFDMLVAKKNNCVIDFVRTGPPGDDHNGREAFEAVIAGFHLRLPEVP